MLQLYENMQTTKFQRICQCGYGRVIHTQGTLKSPPKKNWKKKILEKSGMKYANSSENPVKAVCSRAEPERV